jgi:dienelactone hydrolase
MPASAGQPATPPPAAGSGGMKATPPPLAGSTPPMTQMKPPSAGMLAQGGMGGMAITGTGGMAGTATAAGSGAGGKGAAGMAGGSPAAGSGGGKAPGKGFIRGPDPTDASVMGSAKGPFMVKSYTDGYRDGPAYADSTIWYPVDADPPFAGVAVVPGFVSPQSSIINWGPFLASNGIVTMTIGTNLPTDPPDTRKDALLDALETLKSENTRMGSPLMGKLATDTLATMGWSMGGGGTLLVANEHPEMKATISMCAWNPGYPYLNIKSPALMFASLGDPLAGGQSQGFYASVPDSTPKMLIETPGADHFVANDPASTGGMIGRYGLAWMKVYLEGDERYRKFLLEKPMATTTDFQTNVK